MKLEVEKEGLEEKRGKEQIRKKWKDKRGSIVSKNESIRTRRG